jgi:hypothetical protein
MGRSAGVIVGLYATSAMIHSVLGMNKPSRESFKAFTTVWLVLTSDAGHVHVSTFPGSSPPSPWLSASQPSLGGSSETAKAPW